MISGAELRQCFALFDQADGRYSLRSLIALCDERDRSKRGFDMVVEDHCRRTTASYHQFARLRREWPELRSHQLREEGFLPLEPPTSDQRARTMPWPDVLRAMDYLAPLVPRWELVSVVQRHTGRYTIGLSGQGQCWYGIGSMALVEEMTRDAL